MVKEITIYSTPNINKLIDLTTEGDIPYKIKLMDAEIEYAHVATAEPKQIIYHVIIRGYNTSNYLLQRIKKSSIKKTSISYFNHNIIYQTIRKAIKTNLFNFQLSNFVNNGKAPPSFAPHPPPTKKLFLVESLSKVLLLLSSKATQ